PRAALRSYAEKWEGRASVDAVSYPIVKQFRLAVYERVTSALFAGCREANPDFSSRLLYLELKTWDDLLVAAVDDVIVFLDQQAVTLPRANWGLRNTAQIRHPFS